MKTHKLFLLNVRISREQSVLGRRCGVLPVKQAVTSVLSVNALHGSADGTLPYDRISNLRIDKFISLDHRSSSA
jgi:hypothetical protein